MHDVSNGISWNMRVSALLSLCVCIISSAFVDVNYDKISTDTCIMLYKMYNKIS